VSISKKWRFRIEHILEAIGKIRQYTAGMTEEGFAANQMAVDAVIRNFLVIGEATRHIPDDIQRRYSEIPWALMHGMRNVLVHDYDTIKLEIVWRTIQDKLPPLLAPLRRLSQEVHE
jgi:uncharacterized protein with HEPN domain